MINMRRSPTSSPTGLLRYVVVLGLVVAVASRGRANATTADDLCAPNADPCSVATRVTVTDGSVLAFGTRALVIETEGALDVGSGMMTITAGSLTVLGGAALQANGRGEAGGRISVSADTIIIAGTISADGTDGGTVALAATHNLVSAGPISANGMPGVGGAVDLMGETVSIAGDVRATGLGDSLGGCVTVGADGNVDLVGSVRVTGGDGGEIAVVAGLVGGDLRIGPDAALNASGAGANGGSGGIIEISARGDGIANGHLHLDGDLLARAGSLQGGDGGCITVSAAGDIIGESTAAELNVNSGTPDGFAGEITVVAAGNVELKTELLAQGTGSEGAGGDVDVQAGGDLLVDEIARISVAGPGDGGSINLAANEGEVLIRSGSVDASGTSGGDGGDIRISASGMQGRIVVAGTVLANGSTQGSAPGRGGAIEISAGHTLILPGPPTPLGGRLHAQGGTGGTITMRTMRGPLQLDGTVSAGGTITAISGSDLTVGGGLDAADNFRGGRIGLEASGAITIDGMLDASVLSSTEGSGGTIDVVGSGPVSITGQLTVDGSGSVGTLGGSLAVRGCDLNLAAGSSLSARGTRGLNRVTGRRALVISGMVTADVANGRNELVYRDPANPPVIFASARVVPAATLVVDATLPACAVCGNRDIEPPETCDDGNQNDGDGCSSTCQVEAAPCDADGDGDIDQDDIVALERELFDGDGDRTVDVGGGAFPGTVGADANEDGRISSADISRCIEVLGGE